MRKPYIMVVVQVYYCDWIRKGFLQNQILQNDKMNINKFTWIMVIVINNNNQDVLRSTME